MSKALKQQPRLWRERQSSLRKSVGNATPSTGPHYVPEKLRAGTDLLMPSATMFEEVLKLWRQHDLLLPGAVGAQGGTGTALIAKCAILLDQPLQKGARELQIPMRSDFNMPCTLLGARLGQGATLAGLKPACNHLHALHFA